MMTHKMVFATHNEHKLQEVRDMLQDTSFKLVGAGELNLPDVQETGLTFKDNALLKAYDAYKHTGLPALADDSGLCIQALNNEPGVFSHRFAQQHGGFPSVFKTINDLLAGQDRRAFFGCTMALVFDETEAYTFEGILNGRLLSDPRGESGFGYDPIFVPDGYDITLAQMSSVQKNSLSHRHKALCQVVDFLKTRQK